MADQQTPETQDDEPRLFPVLEWGTRREVARYLRTTPQALASLATRGKGPKYRRVSGRALYRWTDVEAWADANPVQGGGNRTYRRAI